MAISKIQSESINLTDSFGFTGHVIQSVTATSGFTNQTINSATKVHLTNMTVTITPKFSNSKMLVLDILLVHGLMFQVSQFIKMMLHL